MQQPPQLSLDFETPRVMRKGGIRLITANGVDPLFDHLAGRMGREMLPPFEFETILLPHGSALRPWLSQRLADRIGCAAGLYTPTLREYADSLIRRMPDAEPAALDRHTLTWRIFAVLNDLPDAEDVSPVRRYLQRAGGQTMPLARRLARLFDSYQTLRTDVLERWQRGEVRSEAERWQALIWQRIVAEMPAPHRHRAEQLRELVDHLSTEAPVDLPRRISIFGESVLPPVYLGFLFVLARHVDVTWYAVETPDAADHPLVEILGDDARMATRLRQQWIPNMPAQRIDADMEEAPTSDALTALQGDILLGRRRAADERVPISPVDASLRIHDCHSPTRELEVMRDQLLDAFETIDGLQPSDVLVVVPDLDRYAALVEAVFEAGDEDQRLHAAVARDPREEGRRYLTAFEAILEALTSRLTASTVLELLSEPAIARRAGFDADTVDVVRGWIRQTHIRWGLDADHRAAFGLPEDDLHTWRHGLDRLLMGIVAGEVDEGVDGVLPHAEGTLDRAPTLGRLASWMQAMADAVREAARPRTPAAWREWIEAIVVGFLQAESEEEQMAEDHLLAELRDMAELAPEVEIDFPSLRNHLVETLAGFEGRGRLLAGAITVADFERLHYIPARVIACIGLNDDALPRNVAAADFDLVASTRRDGDPDPRRLDKQLFLDTLLSARDRLILTYNGRSQKDNTERAPSIVIEALLETLTQTFTAGDTDRAEDARRVRHHFVVEHPLQPFSPRYFDSSNPRLFSFDRTNCIPPADELKPIAAFADAPLAESEPAETITLDDLIDAWTNPSKFYCRKLDLRLELSDLTVEDFEPQFLDHLESYKINARTLELLLDGLPEDDVRERLRMEGSLPAGALGRILYETARADIEPLLRKVDAFGERHPVEIDIEVAGRRLVGTIPYVTEEAVLNFRPAKDLGAKDRIKTWVHHLALAISIEERPSHLFAREEAQSITSVDEPLKNLESLVERYEDILRQPMILFPNSSMELASEKGTIKSALGKFDGSKFSRGDCEDVYVSFLNLHHHPIHDRVDDFEREAVALWGPIYQHLILFGQDDHD